MLQQFLSQNGIASLIDYDLSLGIHQIAIDRLDGYLVERRIGLARVDELKQQDNVISSKGVIKRTFWYLPFNRNFYHKNQVDVERLWHNVRLARQQILENK